MSNRPWSASNGPRTPKVGTPPLAAGAFRRTTTVEARRTESGVSVAGRGRDLEPAGHHPGVSAVNVAFEAETDAGGVLAGLTAHGDVDHAALVGTMVHSGWNRLLAGAVPGGRDAVLGALLGDLPIVAGLTTYGAIYTAHGTGFDPERAPANVCAGWEDGGVLLTNVRERQDIPLPHGPQAPPLEPGELDGWHQMDPPAPMTFRRARRVDVISGPVVEVDAHLRDSFADPEGVERIVHEYGLTVRIDPETELVEDIAVIPHVLPWFECPAATSSAARAVGQRIASLDAVVATEFRGTSTCTHLNAVLRGVASAYRRANTFSADGDAASEP